MSIMRYCFIENIERLGGFPLPIYTTSAPNPSLGYKGFNWVIENILKYKNKPISHSIITTMPYAQSVLANPGDGTKAVTESIFEDLDVPVLQAMTTYDTLENWEKSIRGIDLMSLAPSVYYPEFDGQIITVTTTYSEKVIDSVGERYLFKPIEERVNKVCRLALNWARLGIKENQEKKVAIIFHNMPPRNDMIGSAFGLDTPNTVFNIVKGLKSIGIKVEYDFENGDHIIKKIIEGVSNDKRWLTAERALEKSVDLIDSGLYKKWFLRLGEEPKKKLSTQWGEAPGDFMVFQGKMPVPGILNGNIFIGLQPSRGYEDKAEEVYHSTDIVPSHQYIAFYKWVKEVFKADVILHIGTHGTLEWLPGKEIGLSKDCYPDINIDDIPHLYPYIIDVPGEGLQAKRRSYSVVIDHLIPSLRASRTYDYLKEIENLIKQYRHSQNGNDGKANLIKEEIINLVIKNSMHLDLKVGREHMESHFQSFLENLYIWIDDIKNSLIKDGLHIFGEVPREERFENLVLALLRLPNGDALSLKEALCIAKGMDFKKLIDDPRLILDSGENSLEILDKLEEEIAFIVKEFSEVDFKEEFIEEIIKDYEKERVIELKKVLYFISEELVPKLRKTKEELEYTLKGVMGRFIPPGGSGCPTRGRVSILPTGRNFYSIDPAEIPTRVSYKIGEKLAHDLINRYLKEEGKYPDSIAIVVYSGETIKTSGDDISEILYLIGVKPVWLDGSDKVIGLEVIPIEELKRPRIDVTLRISGLFRDTFPNLINLVEDAINLVASLDESYDQNFIKKNIKEEMDDLVSKELSIEEAKEEASMRIFGCPPGTYGAGVSMLINSKQWESIEDLAHVYTLWGGHAYGRKHHGKKVKEVFKNRLSKTDVTVKNESSMEIDMLDSDDFYNYHGGLIAAVKTNSGKTPRSYCGDTSNLERTKIKDVNEETCRIMRSRILNPRWFEGLKRHGYKGAQEVAAMVDIAFGWDATSDVIEDWMYEDIAKTYVLDSEKREWIRSVNPWAVQSMVERLLEANQRGMWSGKEDTIEALKGIYLQIEGDIEEQV